MCQLFVLFCFAASRPVTCVSDGTECDPDRMSVDTQQQVLIPIFIGMVSIVLVTIIFCLSAVYWKLLSFRKSGPANSQESSDRKQHHHISKIHRVSRGSRHFSPESPIQDLRQSHEVDYKAIALQALAYVIAYFSTVGFPLFLYVIDQTSRTLTQAQLLLQPLQGLFNFLIFTSWKIHQYKKLNPTMKFKSILHCIFFERTSDPIFISRSAEVLESKVENQRVLRDQSDNESLGHLNKGNSGISSGLSISRGLDGFDISPSYLGIEDSSSYEAAINSNGNNSLESLGFPGLRMSENEVISDATTVKQ